MSGTANDSEVGVFDHHLDREIAAQGNGVLRTIIYYACGVGIEVVGGDRSNISAYTLSPYCYAGVAGAIGVCDTPADASVGRQTASLLLGKLRLMRTAAKIRRH